MPPAARTAFLDRIRVVLSALVIMHHAAIMFGAPGGWYLTMPTTLMVEKLPLTVFVSVNQSFFMGFFFLLAGYFSAPSFDRHGAGRFLRERLLRLGVPILVYGFILGPMTIALAALHKGQPFLGYWVMLTRGGEFELGPLWFALALLCFSVVYCAWRLVRGAGAPGPGLAPGHGLLFAGALLTGAGAFLLRLWVPVGTQRWLMQIGYFSSYTVLFVAGLALARRKWLEQVGSDIAMPWRLISWLCVPLLFVYAVLGGALQGKPFDTSGGWSLPALAYAFWEPFVAWGIILGMLWRFRMSAHPSPRWQGFSPSAYGAYIVHPPVLVGLGLLLADRPWPNSVRFVIAGVAAVGLSFLLARALLMIPGVRRIL